jgi:hypothetical protein
MSRLRHAGTALSDRTAVTDENCDNEHRNLVQQPITATERRAY